MLLDALPRWVYWTRPSPLSLRNECPLRLSDTRRVAVAVPDILEHSRNERGTNRAQPRPLELF